MANITVSRFLWIREGALLAQSPVTVLWYPPGDTGDFSFDATPDNPQGPPPFVFSGLKVQSASAEDPALNVSYSPSGSTASTRVDTFVVETAGGSTYSAHFAASAGESRVLGQPYQPQAVGGASQEVAAAPRWFLSQMWHYNWSVALDQDLCQTIVNAVNDPKTFFAIGFPVEAAGGTASSYPGPLVARGDIAAFPRFAMVRYQPN